MKKTDRLLTQDDVAVFAARGRVYRVSILDDSLPTDPTILVFRDLESDVVHWSWNEALDHLKSLMGWAELPDKQPEDE